MTQKSETLNDFFPLVITKKLNFKQMLGTITNNNKDQEMQSKKFNKYVTEYLGKLNASKLASDEIYKGDCWTLGSYGRG